jgi:hypothetical protein
MSILSSAARSRLTTWFTVSLCVVMLASRFSRALAAEGDAGRLYEQGITFMGQGDLAGAIDAFERYVKEDTKSERAGRARYCIWLLQSWQQQDQAWRECGQALAGIGDIAGAVLDRDTGWPILVGPKQSAESALRPLALDDLITIFNVVGRGQDPGVSIEPRGGISPFAPMIYTSPPSTFSVRYIPASLKDTHLGYLLFEADRTLKTLCLGEDNLTHERFKTAVLGYVSIPRRMKGQVTGAGFFAAPIFVPKRVELRRAGNTVWFDRIVMGVRSQSSQEAAEEFVKHLEENFDSFARELPSLQELVRVAKMVAVARWLNESASGLRQAGIAGYRSSIFPTLAETPTVTAEVSRRQFPFPGGYRIEIAMLCGGVLLATANTYADATAVAGQASYVGDVRLVDLAKTVMAARPSKAQIAWDFQIAGQGYRAVAIPFGGGSP